VLVNYARIVGLYQKYGKEKKLYLFLTHNGMLKKNSKYNVSGVTSDDLKNLYKRQMLNNKEPRKIYDKLMSLAKLGKCPFCGLGQVSTLDHYLPKSEFPTFSVLPYNLIPCCKDCNHGKSIAYAVKEEEQTLHPYYDNYNDEQWLFADVIESPSLSIRYKVLPPEYLTDIEKRRLKKHFDEYSLDKRFSIEASSELATLTHRFNISSFDAKQIQEHLISSEIAYMEQYVNSWQRALYQALGKSEWYCNGGYKI
jgi:hypothetical protein